MIRSTSGEAYYRLSDLGARQRQVYDLVHDNGEMSNLDIANTLGIPINQVTGRTSELVTMGFLKVGSKRVHPTTKRTVIYWTVKSEDTTKLNLIQMISERWEKEERKAWEGTLFA